MTAVIGILNKSAVVIAADSAVTVTGQNGRKIFNTANKIFKLSKYYPIGVAIYSSASLMTTPWETIIKVYREQLGTKVFETLKEYQIDFINFIAAKGYFTDESLQKEYILNILRQVIRSINENVDLISGIDKLSDDKKKGEIIRRIKDKLSLQISELEPLPNSVLFQNYSKFEFERFVSNEIVDVLRSEFVELMDIRESLFDFLYHYIKSRNYNASTGLVFVGFGENEIYPSCINLEIGEVFDNKLRYHVEQSVEINNKVAAAILPFAQTDVIETILTGIEPKLREGFIESFSLFMKQYNEAIITELGSLNSDLSQKIKNIDVNNIVKEYNKLMTRVIHENYIYPTMQTVSLLSKEDLAEMAESLIYLTYLKRRITFDEESVGGPVDVAIISKGDGFIWIKRKYYFKPELNPHFFHNYFKQENV